MDRLDDTVFYLNSLELKKEINRTAIFDFYNFMNHAASLIDCIRFLGEIYDYNFEEENKHTNIFNQLGKTGHGTDKDYFEYLRSLCSVHPIETSHHPEYRDDFTNVECSPYVCWNNDLLMEDKQYDLVAIVYTNNPNYFSKRIGIKLSEIFSYVEYRYSLLEKLLDCIEKYNQNVIEEFKKQPLKPLTDFSDYCNYLEYLKAEYSERVNTQMEGTFDLCINLMKMTFKNEHNNRQLKKFQNAIKYTFEFVSKYLQVLPDDDSFEATGLQQKDEITTGDSLLFQLFESPRGNELREFDYPLEKLPILAYTPDYLDYSFAAVLVRELKPFWEPYVCIEEKSTKFEIGVLILIACHFYKLEHDTDFQSLFPDTMDYR